MSKLTAVFELIDRMSDKMDAIASRGERAVESWERMGDAANEAQGAGVAAAAEVASAVTDYSSAIDGAAGTTDYWTDAVGSYNKNALEAVHSTEELVEMGLKSADALEEEQSVMELAQMASEDLSSAIEKASDIQDEYAEAVSEAAEIAEKAADSDKVSQEAKEALQEATESAAEALEELESAQKAAQAAQENYNAVTESGAASITDIEAASLEAAEAADNLAAANEKAMNATEELSKAADKAGEEAENAEQSGINAVDGIAGALAAAGITAAVKEIAEAVYDLAVEFSEAESTIVLATGATGDALDSLTDSMMNAYAASKTGTLSDTASAVGEINTRLGYTGDTLEETTEMFLDFADVTGGNAASSVRNVTQLMNQWNVDASEMESMLSKLTYAGQASGISVDTLSSQLTNNKAILDQLGFSLDEATAMFMNMELQGTQTSSVMTGFGTALSNGAISSLEELYNVLELAEEGLLSAEEASDIFGSRAGTAIVNAAQSGVFNLEDFVGALENADGTLKTTADAAQTLDEKWEQATNNISAAFTSAVQPAVDGISSALAELVNGIGTFLNEHPAVTKAITAIGVGLGVVVTGIAGVATVTKVVIPLISTLGTTLNTALGPIGWVALAITGVVAAGTALAAMMSDTEDATEGMTAVTRKQYYELESLNAEYDEACEKYGENSEEALRLKYQVDDLSEAFESNRQTVEEFQAEVDELCSSVSAVADDFSSAMKEIDSQETGTLALIQKYEDLAAQTELTGAQQQEFESIAQELTETFPDLSDKIDSATGSTEDYIDAMRRLCEEQAEEQRQAEEQQAYVDAL
ncbi:MAG: phage tail tape measure protein, partial [Ruminococcus sp.]|nr:phage tail tape measure protein [Ruminococcus sp.]